MFYKILSIILGVLMIGTGIYCVATPVTTYAILPTIIGIVMLAEGIGCIVAWAQSRKEERKSTVLLLINAILSVILGILVLMNDMLQLSMAATIPIFVSSWMVVTGIFRIVDSFYIKKLNKETRKIVGRSEEAVAGRTLLREVSKLWWIHLISGILLVIAGALSFTSPVVTMVAIGVYMGIDIIVTGVNLITLACIAE